MTKDEALKLAAQAVLNQWNSPAWTWHKLGPTGDLMADLQEALAQPVQPVQEPVAYLCENAVGHKYFRWKKPSSTYKPIALYTTPSQQPWAGLTEDEAIELLPVGDWEVESTLEFACAVEAKLKQKNT